METRNGKFQLGEIVVTPAATAEIAAGGLTLDELLARHQAGDWGDVSPQTKAVNERGLHEQMGLQSSYQVAPRSRVIVSTNHQRTRTMVHLDSRTQ